MASACRRPLHVPRALLLCAGFGTRLQREMKQDPAFAKLVHVPKPLLPVGGVPLLEHWILWLLHSKHFGGIADIFCVCNARDLAQYQAWARLFGFPQHNLICNGVRNNATRRGAIADIEFGIREAGLGGSHLIVIGADMFPQTPRALDAGVGAFLQSSQADALLPHYALDETENVSLYGVIELAMDTGPIRRVTAFVEKPANASISPSRNVVPCFYVFAPSVYSYLVQYLAAAQSLQVRDATGSFIAWLIEQITVGAVQMPRPFYDIGNFGLYKAAIDVFGKVYVE